MIKPDMGHSRQAGFTLIELMLATTVFSVILLIGLAGFVQIGRAYYKGITISQTQEVAKQIVDDVSAQIRLGASVSSLQSATNGRNYYCVGSYRYTFKLYNKVNTSAHDFSANFGLIQDSLPGGSGCGNPFDSPSVPLVSPSELLGNQMRLLAFSVAPVAGSPNLYSLNVVVASGQDSALSDPNSSSAVCKNQNGSDQFCAITNINTVVYKGS